MKQKFSDMDKAAIALKALCTHKTLKELSLETGVHPSTIALWKKRITENAFLLFSDKAIHRKKEKNQEIDLLYRQIGKLHTEVFLLMEK